MGEPISVATAAVAATSTAYKISCSLYGFIQSAKKVDTTIELLYTAVVRLEASLKNVDATLKSPGVIEATKNRSLYAGSLKAIDCAIRDCEHTLRAFSDVLPGQRTSQKFSMFKKAVDQIKLNLSQSEMNSLRSHIQAHSTSLQIAMHTLTLDIACQSSQGLREDLAIGLDTIADIITTSNPLNKSPDSEELPSCFVNAALSDHTSNIVATAREVMSTAQSVLSETSRSGSIATIRRKPVQGPETATSEVGVRMATEDRNRIMNWIPSQHSSGNIWTSTISSSTMMTPSTTDSESTRWVEVRDSDDHLEDDDLEIEAVGAMFKTGSDHMTQSEFADAEGFLSAGVKRLASMSSVTQNHFDIDEQRLWLAYSRLYQAKTLDLFAALQPLCQSKSNPLRALRALHAIAQVHICDMRHSNFELAERTCRQVIKDLRTQYGEDSRYHVLYHRSLTLLAGLCRLRDENAVASTYLNLIPSASDVKKDGVMDDVPEPSIHQIRHLSYRVQTGDHITLNIELRRTEVYSSSEDSDAPPATSTKMYDVTVGDRSWPQELYAKILGMRIGEKKCLKIRWRKGDYPHVIGDVVVIKVHSAVHVSEIPKRQGEYKARLSEPSRPAGIFSKFRK